MKAAIAAAVASLSLALCGLAQADQNDEGKTFGKSQLTKLKNGVSSKNAKDAPLYNINPPQKSSYGAASLFEVGAGRINTCRTAAGTGNKIADQECEAVNFIAKNPENRVRFDLSPSDPAVIASRGHANNAGGMLDQITGGQECVDKTTTTPAEHAIESCVEYLPIEDKSCTIGQQVDVDADSNFQCEVTYQALERVTCQKRLTVTCASPPGCNLGGVVGTPEGDMQVKTSEAEDGSLNIEFGVLGDRYWSGDEVVGKAYDRTMTVELADKSLVQLFKLTRARWDDWLLVSVNGTVVFVGPKGGDRLEQVQQYTGTYRQADGITCTYSADDGGARYECRQADYSVVAVHNTCSLSAGVWNCDRRSMIQTSSTKFWPVAELNGGGDSNPNIDLRPYLKTGSNVIFTRTIVGGGGDAYLVFNTQVQCPTVCKDVWDDQCVDYRARTQ